MPTTETVTELALALPEVEQRPSYGTPAFFVRKKLFARLLDDDAVVLKLDFDQREVLMNADPQTFYITDHYRNYPMMIVRLASVDPADLQELLEEAWRRADGRG